MRGVSKNDEMMIALCGVVVCRLMINEKDRENNEMVGAVHIVIPVVQ